MTYGLLGQDLHDTADKAKKWFADHYGAKKFACEQPIFDLPLKPTWQAVLHGGYSLCVNVQPTPFSPTLYAFVNQCAQEGLPVKLWVAIGASVPKESFASELKQARNAGVGVIQFPENGAPHEFHHAMPLSLFGLTRVSPKKLPKSRREVFRNAEDTFLDGSPGQGCQTICQELEDISRLVAEKAHALGWWKNPTGSKPLSKKFFAKTAWATVLEKMEQRANVSLIKAKCPKFTKHLIVRTRAYTEWRNAVSHKPNNLAALKARDKKLRTMFEATSDLLVDWYDAVKPLGLIK